MAYCACDGSYKCNTCRATKERKRREKSEAHLRRSGWPCDGPLPPSKDEDRIPTAADGVPVTMAEIIDTDPERIL